MKRTIMVEPSLEGLSQLFEGKIMEGKIEEDCKIVSSTNKLTKK